MLKVILNRLKPKVEKITAEEQAGFRAGRSTTEQIFNLRILCEKYLTTMKKYNISTNHIQVIKNLCYKASSAVLFNNSIGDWFRTTVGV